MCGITGYLDLENGIRTDILHRMNDVIVHRGPDDEGYLLIGNGGQWSFRGRDTMAEIAVPPLETANGAEAFLGFGHRRLSILDLSANGHQPMCLPERELAVTYNGEIYNYLELREELTALGYTFRTTCDTEVLLYAYCQWGEDCLSHFNGMWGFAIWDGRNNRLFCARDRLGAKPFHYWRSGNQMLFGSELKQLCQDDTVPRHFDPTYLVDNVVFNHSDYSEQTLIQDFYALLPAHKLTVQLSADRRRITDFRVEPYWTLDTTVRQDWSLETCMELWQEAFSRSCRWRLRSDAPLAAMLSGGVDSSGLVAEVCRQLGDPSRLETFTASYPGRKDCDEWHYADLVNRHCGCRGNQICPDPKDSMESLYETCIWHTEGYINFGVFGLKTLVDEIHNRGYKVVLNGQCSDEVLFGYDWHYSFYLASLLKQGRVGQFARTCREIRQNSAIPTKRLIAEGVYFNSPLVRTKRKLHAAKAIVQDDMMVYCDRTHVTKYLHSKNLEDLIRHDLTSTSLPSIVRLDDRLYMSASLESRLPFMDYRLVEIGAQIPPQYKIRNGYTKDILREVFSKNLPAEVVWRKDKMGFAYPQDRYASYFSQDYLLDRISHAKTAAYFKTDSLKQMAEQTPTAEPLFQFLAIEQFARQFGVE